jgi:hypothetical protein
VLLAAVVAFGRGGLGLLRRSKWNTQALRVPLRSIDGSKCQKLEERHEKHVMLGQSGKMTLFAKYEEDRLGFSGSADT